MQLNGNPGFGLNKVGYRHGTPSRKQSVGYVDMHFRRESLAHVEHPAEVARIFREDGRDYSSHAAAFGLIPGSLK
jgi:hypothetical protein